ncbi:hypothetical protein HRbin27_01735 [bacterium HR27]|nr:hypothetical protein HRbin27_01735 [bacterium HR27]
MLALEHASTVGCEEREGQNCPGREVDGAANAIEPWYEVVSETVQPAQVTESEPEHHCPAASEQCDQRTTSGFRIDPTEDSQEKGNEPDKEVGFRRITGSPIGRRPAGTEQVRQHHRDEPVRPKRGHGRLLVGEALPLGIPCQLQGRQQLHCRQARSQSDDRQSLPERHRLA